MMNISLESLKGMVDEAKVMVVPKTEVEKRIYEAISNKNWGASSTLMNQIAADTYDYEKYAVVMKQIWGSMDGPGRNWRSVFKALTLLEHLVKNGAERIVEDVRDHMHKIRTLTDFNYYEGSQDRGSGVREKAKQLIELLGDNERIRDEREKSRRLRDKFIGIGATGGTTGISGGLGNTSGGSRYDGFSAQDYHRSEMGGGGSRGGGGDRPGRYTDSGARSPASDYGGNRDSYSRDSYSRDRDFSDRGGSRPYDPAPEKRHSQRQFDPDPVSPPPEDDYKHGSSKAASSGTRRKSKDKIEVKLKKEISGGATIVSPPAPVKPPTPAQDLLGDDFFGEPKAAGGNGFGADPFDDFNPRGAGTAAPQAAPQQQHSDPFFAPSPAPPAPSNFYGAQPPQPPASSTPAFSGFAAPAPAPFDPFAAPSPAPAPFTAAPAQPSSAPSFGAPSPSTAGGFGFGGPVSAAPAPAPGPPSGFGLAPQQPQQPMYGATAYGGFTAAPAPAPFSGGPTGFGAPASSQPARGPSNPLGDFGDFQTGPSKTSAPAPLPATSKPLDPWGGLVNLGNLAEEQPKKPDGAGGVGGGMAPADHFSFTDLDSFAKSKQQPAPVSLGQGPRPMGTGMGAPPPMGFGAPSQPMGGFGGPMMQAQPQYGAAPQYGGAPVMGGMPPQQQQQQAPRGYPAMQQQPQAQNPFGAAPQAGFGYPQQPQAGYGMPAMQTGYPQQPSGYPQQQQQQQQYGGFAQQQAPRPFGGF